MLMLPYAIPLPGLLYQPVEAMHNLTRLTFSLKSVTPAVTPPDLYCMLTALDYLT